MNDNQLQFDSSDPKLLVSLMKKRGSLKYPLLGKNDREEDIEIHISEDSIVYKTYQRNGWLRVNYFDENGYPAGETFDGRWDI